jgi:hypothetical protein
MLTSEWFEPLLEAGNRSRRQWLGCPRSGTDGVALHHHHCVGMRDPQVPQVEVLL